MYLALWLPICGTQTCAQHCGWAHSISFLPQQQAPLPDALSWIRTTVSLLALGLTMCACACVYVSLCACAGAGAGAGVRHTLTATKVAPSRTVSERTDRQDPRSIRRRPGETALHPTSPAQYTLRVRVRVRGAGVGCGGGFRGLAGWRETRLLFF